MSSARTGNGRDDWGTPTAVLNKVRQLGYIGLDPCCDDDNATSLLSTFSVEEDGLTKDWNGALDLGGLVYCNFPYSKAAAWAEKIATEAAKGVPIIVLCAARPGTRWWRRMWAAADVVAFWHGRITFVGAKTGAPFPSALLGFNVSHRRFRNAFADVADVVVPT